MSGYGSSSKGKYPAHGSSAQRLYYQQTSYQQAPYQQAQAPYQQTSYQQAQAPYQQAPYQQPQASYQQPQAPYQQTPYQQAPSTGGGPSADARNWDLILNHPDMPNINLNTRTDLEVLAVDLYHLDFQLSRAWLCFGEENLNGDVGTNHVFLKFDIEPCARHPWLGIKLEVKDDQGGSPESGNTDSSDPGCFPANPTLGLKTWSGKPNGLKYAIELRLLSRDMTVGDLIRLHLLEGLTSFFYMTKKSNTGYRAIVGCRDFIAQVLLRLEAQGFITRQFKLDPAKDRTGPQLAYVNSKLEWYFRNPIELFQNDIFAALACFFEESGANRGFPVVLATSSQVEEGYPGLPGRIKPDNAYPYHDIRPFGHLSTKIGELQAKRDNEAHAGPSGASMPGPSGQTHPAQPYTGQYPTSQLQFNTGRTVHPGPDDVFKYDRRRNLYYFRHRQTNEKIYVDTARQPYPGQWPNQISE